MWLCVPHRERFWCQHLSFSLLKEFRSFPNKPDVMTNQAPKQIKYLLIFKNKFKKLKVRERYHWSHHQESRTKKHSKPPWRSKPQNFRFHAWILHEMAPVFQKLAPFIYFSYKSLQLPDNQGSKPDLRISWQTFWNPHMCPWG